MIQPLSGRNCADYKSTPVNKSESVFETSKTEEDNKKQLDALKKQITEKLNNMQPNYMVKHISVRMSDSFLESCLKDPQVLEDAMKSLEDFFKQPVTKGEESRGYAFLGVNDIRTINRNNLSEGRDKSGLWWEKDFENEDMKQTVEDLMEKRLAELPEKLSQEMMMRTMKAYISDKEYDKRA